MLNRIRFGALVLIFPLVISAQNISAQNDWPIATHDPGGTRYSPLKQIDTKNVSKLHLVWEFDTLVEDPPPATPPPNAVAPVETAPGVRPTPPRKAPAGTPA